MQPNEAVKTNYAHGALLEAIEKGLMDLGVDVGDVTVDQLGPVEEFHIGGRQATQQIIDRIQLRKDDRVLDVGCGLGGAARFVHTTAGCSVEGIDLSHEYVAVGGVLNAWVGCSDSVRLHSGSALELPFDDASFTAGYMLHVGMNIADKVALFREVARVLEPGARFAVYDVMKSGPGEPTYPVPWASSADISHLESPAVYAQILSDAGFEVTDTIDRSAFGLEFFAAIKAKTERAGGPPPLGLHLLMGASTSTRIGNMVAGITNGIIAPTEMYAIRR